MGNDLVIFRADVADANGQFDGSFETIVYNHALATVMITDGAGKSTVFRDVHTPQQSDTPHLDWMKLDVDGDGTADPFAIVRPQADSAPVVYAHVSRTDLKRGSDINGDGIRDAAMPLNNALRNTLAGRMVGQTAPEPASGMAVVLGTGTAPVGPALKQMQDRPGSLLLAGHAKAYLGDWGIDLSARDLEVKAGDDFNLHANGKWLERTVIPATRSSVDSFSEINERNIAQVQNILTDAVKNPGAPGSDAQKIADYYKAYVDTAAIEARGLAPFQADLDYINSLTTPTDIARAMGEAGRRGWDGPMSYGVGTDSANSSRRVTYVGFSGLGMGSRDYYLEEGADKDALRADYVTYMENMLRMTGHANPRKAAEDVMAFETEIARLTWKEEDQRDPTKTYNPVTLAELKTLSPDFDWDTMLNAAGVGGQDKYVAGEKKDFAAMTALMAKTSAEVWRPYLTLSYLNEHRATLPQALRDERFDFYGRKLYGQLEPLPREKAVTYAIESGLGEEVGRIYVDRHFPAASKQQLQEMVDNLITQFERRLEGQTDLLASTKQAGLDKVRAFTTNIGYPDKWRGTEGLVIKADDAAGNLQRIRQFNYDRTVAELNDPVDKSRWSMTPQTVNAYYSRVFNEIVFPAGILQPPFFDAKADPAVNYGAIGGIIGHEISHGFDNGGSRYDANGNLRDWWAPEDRALFDKRVTGIVGQYNQYQAFGNLYVNGQLTAGENIADLVGLTIAHDAYKASLGGKPAPVLNGLTGDQRFFLSWAQAYQERMRESALENQIRTDPHAPGQFRIKGIVPNIDAWYEAFGIQPGDAMYIAPEDRIRIW